MENNNELKNRLEEIVSKVAQKLNLKNYKINLDFGEQLKNGFVAELFFASITDLDKNKEIPLAIKRSFEKVGENFAEVTSTAFENEIYFYETVRPAFEKFQKDRGVKQPFDNVAKCYLTQTLPDLPVLVFENVSKSGYEMYPKAKVLPQEYIELIFSTYAKYHAISFAMKDQDLENYEKLTSGIKKFFGGESSTEMWEESLTAHFEMAYSYFENDTVILEKLKAMRDETFGIFDSFKGPYTVLQHGDCWSNNMMFKCNEKSKALENICILDWQVIREGSPVSDLAYFFYTGAEKKDYDNLDYYLKFYHDHLSEAIRNLGSDPEKLFPFDVLKTEWVKWAKIGLAMGLMIFKIKLTEEKELREKFNSELVGEEGFSIEAYNSLSFNEQEHKKRSVELILHLDSIGVLR